MTLIVGVPRERKEGEHRVAVTPEGVRELTGDGVTVLVEAGAGGDSAVSDLDYTAAGAEVLDDPGEVWKRSELVCKVKEPQPDEFQYLREGLTLFAFLHLAAYPEVAERLRASGTTGVAYETVQDASGALPLLAPMSEVAGRMTPQIGAHFLEREQGGRGVLLGGAPGVRPARVLILGGGNVGWNAAWIAQGMEAEVVLLDRDVDRLRWVDQIHRGRIMTLASNRGAVERNVAECDVLIGAVLVAGDRAPVLVSEEMVSGMRRGSVVIDVAVDQGGCIETSRETTHEEPVYEHHGVLHYGVGNIPAAVPHTSTYALANSTLPYLRELAVAGPRAAAAADPALEAGLNVVGGSVVNLAVARALGTEAVDPAEAWG